MDRPNEDHYALRPLAVCPTASGRRQNAQPARRGILVRGFLQIDFHETAPEDDARSDSSRIEGES